MKRHFIFARAWPGWSALSDLGPIAELPEAQVIPALDELAKRWDREHPGLLEEVRRTKNRSLELLAQARGGVAPPDHPGSINSSPNNARPLLDEVAELAGWAWVGPGLCAVGPGRSCFYPSEYRLIYGCEDRAQAEGVLSMLRSQCSYLESGASLIGGHALIQFTLSPADLSSVERAHLELALQDMESHPENHLKWLCETAREARRFELLLESESSSARRDQTTADRRDGHTIEHAVDFAWIKVGRTTYSFTTAKQRSLIEVLHKAWVQSGCVDGCGLTESAIQDGMGISVERLRVGRILKGTGALNSIVRKTGPLTWALFMRDPAQPKGDQKAQK